MIGTASGWAGYGRIMTAAGWPTDITFCLASGYVQEPFAGGYGTALERRILKGRAKRELEERLAEEAQEAAHGDPLQTELAQLLHANIARQAELDDLKRLQKLIKRQSLDRSLPDKVQRAFEKAQADASFSRLQALEREYLNMLDEEEHALLMTLALLD
jgi:hypothetical protein